MRNEHEAKCRQQRGAPKHERTPRVAKATVHFPQNPQRAASHPNGQDENPIHPARSIKSQSFAAANRELDYAVQVPAPGSGLGTFRNAGAWSTFDREHDHALERRQQRTAKERDMRKAILVGSTAIAFGMLGGAAIAQTKSPSSPSTGAAKMTQAECAALWNRVDASKAGNLSESQAKAYVTDFKALDTNGDKKLSESEFQAGCDKGLVHSTASTGAGAGSMAPGGSTAPGATNPTPKK
jgi:hypothetical protein